MLPKCSSFIVFLPLLVIELDFNVIQCKKIPEDIPLCAKNDPKLSKCLTNLFNSEKHRLKNGIPQMGLAKMEPYFAKELVLFSGLGGNMKAISRNTTFHGMSNVTFDLVKANPDKQELIIEASFPYLDVSGNYDVNGNFAGIRLKGAGKLTAYAIQARIILTFQGEFTTINGEEHLIFNKLASNVNATDFASRLDGLTRSKTLNDATNTVLHKSRFIIFKMYKSAYDKCFAELFGEILNQVAKTVPCKEFFI